MPIQEPQYFSSPESYNWLDAISGDKSLIDPRTYEVYETAWMQYPARWNSRLACTNLERLGKRKNDTFIQNWVQKTVLIMDTMGYEPIPPNDVNDIESEIEDVYSDLEDLEELKRMFPIQLEAVPPFPKQSQWDNSLFATHMQTRRRDSFQHLPNCSSHETSDGEPRPLRQPTSETNSIVVSSLPKSQNSYEELNIGELIVGKLRRAVVHGREAYRSFHNLMRD
ncbi:hypothetical protein N7486_001532 [Penicillium sp. IBT 16267x]|nr:hypothetical protein N7486_001532 [Penicillium sp. IBT 16267x]